MAGSFNHLVSAQGHYTPRNIDNLRDAMEALQECWDVICELSGYSVDRINAKLAKCGHVDIDAMAPSDGRLHARPSVMSHFERKGIKPSPGVLDMNEESLPRIEEQIAHCMSREGFIEKDDLDDGRCTLVMAVTNSSMRTRFIMMDGAPAGFGSVEAVVSGSDERAVVQSVEGELALRNRVQELETKLHALEVVTPRSFEGGSVALAKLKLRGMCEALPALMMSAGYIKQSEVDNARVVVAIDSTSPTWRAKLLMPKGEPLDRELVIPDLPSRQQELEGKVKELELKLASMPIGPAWAVPLAVKTLRRIANAQEGEQYGEQHAEALPALNELRGRAMKRRWSAALVAKSMLEEIGQSAELTAFERVEETLSSEVNQRDMKVEEPEPKEETERVQGGRLITGDTVAITFDGHVTRVQLGERIDRKRKRGQRTFKIVGAGDKVHINDLETYTKFIVQDEEPDARALLHTRLDGWLDECGEKFHARDCTFTSIEFFYTPQDGEWTEDDRPYGTFRCKVKHTDDDIGGTFVRPPKV